ncbi:maleylacetate reductase [Shimia sediminis]|uniref:maleylacetate reductase n=1 Tax=Shimia sediminis TaxID=2497945 RepID=UPI000F8CF9AC|nr:maleylacetate reductase [Shimia sediminis]
MVSEFTYNANPARIVFGRGVSANVAAEISGLGCSRALVLSTPFQAADAKKLAGVLGSHAVGVFSNAAMHTPVGVTQEAMVAYETSGADCVVSLGGGSTIGLGKAIAYRNDAPQIVIATTYAGSEVTPILGQTENGLKTTIRSAKVLPEVVIYDPELTVGLPVGMSVTSGLNAMAHAVEAVYAENRNPVTSLMAIEGVRALRESLPAIVKRPDDIEARSEALYGAWLCGAVLGTVGMALHHKICHTLGGTFDLPHADTHAIMLPHSAAYNAPVTAKEMAPLAELFGGSIGGGLWDFAKSLNAPLALRDLQVNESDLDRAADIATQNPYWNPRPIEHQAIRELLQRAFEGRRPE